MLVRVWKLERERNAIINLISKHPPCVGEGLDTGKKQKCNAYYDFEFSILCASWFAAGLKMRERTSYTNNLISLKVSPDLFGARRLGNRKETTM